MTEQLRATVSEHEFINSFIKEVPIIQKQSTDLRGKSTDWFLYDRDSARKELSTCNHDFTHFTIMFHFFNPWKPILIQNIFLSFSTQLGRISSAQGFFNYSEYLWLFRFLRRALTLQNHFYGFHESSLKRMKDAFYFILKAFPILVWSCRKTAWQESKGQFQILLGNKWLQCRYYLKKQRNSVKQNWSVNRR